MGKLRDNLSISACTSAARNGDLEELKSLREQGFPWDAQTLVGGCSDGGIHIVRWAINNGCPIDYDKDDENYKRMLGYGECGEDIMNVCNNLAMMGDIEIMKLAMEKGAPLRRSSIGIAELNKHKKLAEWLKIQTFVN